MVFYLNASAKNFKIDDSLKCVHLKGVILLQCDCIRGINTSEKSFFQ